jgi:sec-independent protein translocase protein TatC
MISYTRYAILAIFILAAVLTPGPDIASQFLMAGPLLILYVLSIAVAYVFAKERPKPEEPESPDA